MASEKLYSLPALPYGYKDLEPHMSEEQLKIHHDKHHLAYVNGANTILEKLDKAIHWGTDDVVHKGGDYFKVKASRQPHVDNPTPR